MYDCIIIGSGPAGLGAAVYAKRAGLDLLVLEKNYMSGGQILNTAEVDNYLGMPGIGGFDMGMRFREHADRLGVEFREEEVIKLEDKGTYKTVTTPMNSYDTRTVILATGAVHAKLNVPGEEELTGHGVSYCATCDGAFFRKKKVAVVGGGDVALEDADYLANLCEKVTVIHRRDSFRGTKVLQDKLSVRENVEYLMNSQVTKIQGQDHVEKIIVKNTESGEETEISIDGVFIAVGYRPDTGLVKGMIPLSEEGYIPADESCLTKMPGVFVAGDIRTKRMRQIITAVADGANAVCSVREYLNS